MELLDRQILQVKPGQVSENGNTYTLLVTVTVDVYVWNTVWCREVDRNRDGYYYLDAQLYVRDHSGPDDNDPWYWLEAVVPQNDGLTERFLKRWKQTGQHELFDAVEQCRRHFRT